MRRIINEDVQLIHIGPNTALTSIAVDTALRRAQSNKLYAKFYTDKVFIQVNFARDGNISVSSNIKTPSFMSEYSRLSNQGWTFTSVKNFVYQWMQISRKVLY